MADPKSPHPYPTARPVQRSTWWREVLIVAVFYGLYTLVRDIRGTKPVSVDQALTNAQRLIHVERWFGMFHEADFQHFFLPHRWIIELCDDFYGTFHFIAAATVLVLLFFWFPARYRIWRNTLALATGLALIGFYFFPLMPPRLLPAGYHFVDTLKVIGGLWNFSQGPVNDVSNQYAAMPSLHTTWSMWCACAVYPVIRNRWVRPLVFLYPAITVFAIVVTANHFFGDVIAGLVLLGVAYGLARALTAWIDRRATGRLPAPAPAATGAPAGQATTPCHQDRVHH
ncbi:MAG TPA: phosphatase PAP2 family protein [Acidimicrobiales bacterium]|nr:phosphatase PAP2 family protein [Acidimicrobiales bacterium]